MGAVFLFDCITPGRRDLLRNKGKFKNPIEFIGKCGGLPGKMDRALEKSGERGRDFLCCFFPEEPLYYILWKPFMQMEDYKFETNQ